MRGLEALPAFRGEVLRGISAAALDVVRETYGDGCDVHWSSFTSTTTSLATAKQFAGAGGIIFRVNVVTGRSVVAYSAVPREDEIILSPNSRFVVTRACELEGDGFHYVHMQQRAGTGVVF